MSMFFPFVRCMECGDATLKKSSNMKVSEEVIVEEHAFDKKVQLGPMKVEGAAEFPTLLTVPCLNVKASASRSLSPQGGLNCTSPTLDYGDKSLVAKKLEEASWPRQPLDDLTEVARENTGRLSTARGQPEREPSIAYSPSCHSPVSERAGDEPLSESAVATPAVLSIPSTPSYGMDDEDDDLCFVAQSFQEDLKDMARSSIKEESSKEQAAEISEPPAMDSAATAASPAVDPPVSPKTARTSVTAPAVPGASEQAAPAQKRRQAPRAGATKASGSRQPAAVSTAAPATSGQQMQLRPAVTFKVRLPAVSSRTRIGLDIEEFISHLGKALRILSVHEEGRINEWNITHRTREVRAGDFIVEVNGVAGDIEGMAQALLCDGPVEITIKRVIQPTMNIPKRQPPLKKGWLSSSMTSSRSMSTLSTFGSFASALRKTTSSELTANP